ncbi:MAG: Virulence factor Mce family protein [Solirubrobacterales bacterium]|nr:Virulence factor Mce family protein [Solirubrobacterales bacterium]
MLERRSIRSSLVTVALFGLVALAVMLALFKLSGSLSTGHTYEVKALVPQAGSLSQGVSVTMAGARVGTVQGVHRRGVGALVDIRIDDPAVQPLPKDSTARLAVRTPLGENYVEIIPGRSQQMLAANDIVPPANDDEYVDVDQLLSIFKGRTRDQARKMIQGLGTAVDGRGPQLGATLDHVAGVLQGGSSLTSRLHGDREQIGQLVKQLGDIGYAVGERGESIRVLARQGVTTFTALAQRDAAVRKLITTLPGTLRQVRTTTGTLRSVSDAAAPVLANLAVAVRQVRPAVRELAPAAREGRSVVTQLSGAAPKLKLTLTAAREASAPLAKTLPSLKAVLCQANPALRYLKPYVPDFVSFATGLGASANSYDAIGHTIRLMPVVGENSTLGLPDDISKTSFELTHSGLFGASQGLSFVPYPKPGRNNDVLHPGDPKLTGPKDVAASGFRYERVKKDC